MRRVLANAVSEGLVDPDVTPAMRDGRLVIPVAPMNKRRIQGIVHDESASGKTYFIEPAEVVELNNRQHELEIEERREVVRILTVTADAIRPYIDPLTETCRRMGYLDFVRAKAMFAIDTNASLPTLSDSPELEWYTARHPVLEASLARHGRAIVPLSIHLTVDRRLLVISGPNAGGKSVTLKTVGIIQYMMQCGLLPTLYENSRMGIFDSILADIGDDQSLEDDLSTYSSHLRNMNFFLRHGNARSLILIDEFGSGTEPQIGGAIAQALLSRFNAAGMWGVITTHYQNLKTFADETPGLVNGSMLYDRNRMQPLFQLAIGHAGSSFAIEIARKTGLPDDVIDDAREIVGSDYVNLDKYLLDVARDRPSRMSYRATRPMPRPCAQAAEASLPRRVSRPPTSSAALTPPSSAPSTTYARPRPRRRLPWRHAATSYARPVTSRTATRPTARLPRSCARRPVPRSPKRRPPLPRPSRLPSATTSSSTTQAIPAPSSR